MPMYQTIRRYIPRGRNLITLFQLKYPAKFIILHFITPISVGFLSYPVHLKMRIESISKTWWF
jgi:hypothetical protein